jgi:hypothetical protein
MSLRVPSLAHSFKQALAMHATVPLGWAPETHLNEEVGENVFWTLSEDSRHPLTCFLERMTLSVHFAVNVRSIKGSYSSSLHIMIQFITPNRIYVRSLPHLFSNFSMRLFRMLVEGTKVARFWASRIQFTWSHLIIHAFKVHIIHHLHLRIDITSYSIVRRAIASSSNLSQKHLPSQSATKMFAYSS